MAAAKACQPAGREVSAQGGTPYLIPQTAVIILQCRVQLVQVHCSVVGRQHNLRQKRRGGCGSDWATDYTCAACGAPVTGSSGAGHMLGVTPEVYMLRRDALQRASQPSARVLK